MRLIDANRLLEFEKFDAQATGEEHTTDDILMMIKTAPSVDAVPVVRCKECKRSFYDESFGNRWCKSHSGCRKVKDDGFCDLGERKEGADNA